MRKAAMILIAGILVGGGAIPTAAGDYTDSARAYPGARRGMAAIGGETDSARAYPGARRGIRVAGWAARINKAIGKRSMGVAVRLDGTMLYERDARTKRIPASNQKLLLSMALLSSDASTTRLPTVAAAREIEGKTISGNLYILGAGDPTVTGGGPFGRSLTFAPTGIGQLARNIRAAGIRRVRGRVVGSLGYFSHDWFAPGWGSDFPTRYVALPSALSYEGNTSEGIHISDPERRAAQMLTRKLRRVGVKVWHHARAGTAPSKLIDVADVESAPLPVLLRYMNHKSSNFFAEMLGKHLGVLTAGRPGTIAKGAAAIASWADGRAVSLTAHDSSGLSYLNRVAPSGFVRLLDYAEEKSWGDDLRKGLPRGNEGTLEDRLGGIRVRAKTGTLQNVSALSGWVWLDRRSDWASFSMMSRGMPKYKAAAIEDKVVQILAKHAR